MAEADTLDADVRRCRLAILWLAVSVPIVPRLVVPMFRAGEYTDTLQHLTRLPREAGLILAFSVVPFCPLIWGVRDHLRSRSGPARRARRLGLIGAATLAALVGWRVHAPLERGEGFNFGLGLYPLYAALSFPVGYAAGWCFGRVRRPKDWESAP